uniref:Diphthamide biosynthesis protein 1 n=1 Tax=Ananas comosus var. bracteatus TaxID=296719 RepID=A0A6V7PJP4_ANACO|nr:unnamed protein product [Ananas comosus var. bracteatus]
MEADDAHRLLPPPLLTLNLTLDERYPNSRGRRRRRRRREEGVGAEALRALPDPGLDPFGPFAQRGDLPPPLELRLRGPQDRASPPLGRRAPRRAPAPEGLLMYSLLLADALRSDADDVLVLADPTYGACCVADRAAAALSADLLVHYGHSCLVPVPSSLLPVLYVFVDIRVDPTRLAAAVRSAFPDPPPPRASPSRAPSSSSPPSTRRGPSSSPMATRTSSSPRQNRSPPARSSDAPRPPSPNRRVWTRSSSWPTAGFTSRRS